jgi:hypothetical protein
MKCPQRLAVNHQRDRDMVGSANAVEMVLSTLFWARQASAPATAAKAATIQTYFMADPD